MARNITISTARTIVYKEHGGKEASSLSLFDFTCPTKVKQRVRFERVREFTYGSKWVGHERLWIIARNEFHGEPRGRKSLARKKFIHGLWRWLGEQLLGEGEKRIYREEERREKFLLLSSAAGFLLPAWFQIPDLISFNRCNWRTMVFTCQWNCLTLRRNRSYKIWNFFPSKSFYNEGFCFL